jgi:hypothetical protein
MKCFCGHDIISAPLPEERGVFYCQGCGKVFLCNEQDESTLPVDYIPREELIGE